MSYVVADSRPESLSLIAAQHEDWIIRRAIALLEQRIFKAGPMLNSPAAVRDYLHLKLVAEPNEVFAVVFLNSQHQVLAYEPMFKGTVDQTSVYPRVLVQRACPQRLGGHLAHQHPSGMTVPSAADQALTDRLKAAGDSRCPGGGLLHRRQGHAVLLRRIRPAVAPLTAWSPREPRLPLFFRLSAQSGARAVRIPCRGWTAFGVRLEPCSHSRDARHDGSLLETHPAAAVYAHRLRGRAAAVPARRDASAADVLVVTDSRHPVQSASGARVIELDLPERIEAELAAGLPIRAARPRSCSNACAMAAEHYSAASAAPTGRRRCTGLGLAKVPAVVVDRRYVVYGEPMSRAPWHASNHIGGHSHEPPAVGVVAPGPPCHRFGAARRRRSSFALNTATIVSSALSPDCTEYRVVGICYWLFCTGRAARCAPR